MKLELAPHSSTLARKIPWVEEPGKLQSMGSLRVGHDWATSLSLFTFMHWRKKWQPTPVFLPGESQGWGSLVAAVYGVTQSWTRQKWLSSSSRTLSNTIQKNKLKIVWRSKCKTRNYKTPRGKPRQNTLWHKSQQDPLWHTSQSNGNKSKINKWDLIKLKSFSTMKKTITKV